MAKIATTSRCLSSTGNENKYYRQIFAAAYKQNNKRPDWQTRSPEKLHKNEGLLHNNDNNNSNSNSNSSSSSSSSSNSNNNNNLLINTSHKLGILLHQVSQLDPLPPVWDLQTTVTQKESRQMLLDETRQLIRQLGDSVRGGDFDLSNHKHKREIHNFLGECLRIYSHLPGSFKASRDVLVIMRSCDFDLLPTQCEHFVLAAAREKRWMEAAELFRTRTDPNAHGFSPVHISVREPVGLYAIAMEAKLNGKDAAQCVMDAVLNMSMVSPTDQEKYVLAAGAALGRAGEFQSLLKFLRTSYDKERLGQALVASAMHACILCAQNDEALNVYNGSAQVIHGDWQWGGRILDPIFAELAMRASGGMPNRSELALNLLQQAKKDGRKVSVEAIHGVVSACDWDGRWENALSIFLSIFEEEPHWVADGDDLLDNCIYDVEGNARIKKDAVGKILVPTMSACNRAGEFAISLMCVGLLQLRNHDDIHGLDEKSDIDIVSDHHLPFILGFENMQEILVVTMTALCGLQSHHLATKLYENVKCIHFGQLSIDAEECYKHAKSIPIDEHGLLFSKTWERTYTNIYRFAAIVSRWNSASEEYMTAHTERIVMLIAPIMRGLTAVGQPKASIFFAEQIEATFSIKAKGIFASIFEMGKTMDSNAQKLHKDDGILAEKIRAYHSIGASDDAVKLFRDVTGSDIVSGLKSWPKSTNAALTSLLHVDAIDDAVELFETFDWSSRDPDSYLIIARGLAKLELWPSVIDIYGVASDAGCLTEELALLAMKSMDRIVLKEYDGYGEIKFFRVRYISMAISEIVGINEQIWIKERYWVLKDMLSFDCIRYLNGWDDDVSLISHELDLAISQFEESRRAGLKPNVEALATIVKRIGNVDTLKLYDDDVSRWEKILSSVIAEARSTTLATDPRFIHCAMRAWQVLKNDNEYIAMAAFAVEQGVNLSVEDIEILGDEKG